MKIVLVFPPFFLESMYNLPPLGFINLATILERTPHQVRILDFALVIRQKASKMGKHIYDESADQILEERPDVVGFSVQCTTYPAAIHISKKIRDRVPDVKIVFGGHNVFFVDKRVLDCFSFIECAI